MLGANRSQVKVNPLIKANAQACPRGANRASALLKIAVAVWPPTNARNAETVSIGRGPHQVQADQREAIGGPVTGWSRGLPD